ncbi:MAG: hypothetical protein FWD73_14770 [Polyangiaceae bacterium]|nr:hypothetical protein [Polyangiaceae bacterium]
MNNAHQWVELGNCYPASAFSQSMTGPEQYRADLHSEWLLRMPGAMKQALSKNPNDPQVRAALGKELQRLGDRTGVKKGDTVPTLMKRCDDLLAAQAKANAKQTYIESDGYVGTDEQIRFHKGQQYVQTYLKTIIGTTTTGSLLANGTLLAGGDLEQAQTAGKIGNFMEAPFSGLAKQMKKNQERMNNAPTNHPKLDAAEVRSK